MPNLIDPTQIQIYQAQIVMTKNYDKHAFMYLLEHLENTNVDFTVKLLVEQEIPFLNTYD